MLLERSREERLQPRGSLAPSPTTAMAQSTCRRGKEKKGAHLGRRVAVSRPEDMQPLGPPAVIRRPEAHHVGLSMPPLPPSHANARHGVVEVRLLCAPSRSRGRLGVRRAEKRGGRRGESLLLRCSSVLIRPHLLPSQTRFLPRRRGVTGVDTRIDRRMMRGMLEGESSGGDKDRCFLYNCDERGLHSNTDDTERQRGGKGSDEAEKRDAKRHRIHNSHEPAILASPLTPSTEPPSTPSCTASAARASSPT